MIVHALFAASLVLGTAQSPGQDIPAQQDKGIVVTGEANKANKRVCKRSVSTGSVMQKVTCRTVAEWNQEHDKSVAALDLARGDERWRQAARMENDLRPKEDRPR